ncbi:enoyl-CoA hydratase/isomerase family protein [Jannaschia sp. Os4]|uniref:3-hydroxyacyl-CoA dehydrogenase NAD-binding domain-containing protein n=1 Tax=Jannaschia sp. Os4 TaxID=2807617 RepID=UPI00193A2097|nr:3-hydroxyacyl-CoA dehydrogenase NAD-binding domain-containing protein [Jannaschia sp. Os4]MBM2577922.1 enoyl-CoA hydratase/isomerase family protein [Jannaschia sp. Os4]
MTVTIERAGRIARVTIDNPPINAASHAVRRGLVEAVAATEADGAVAAVVLRAAGRTFTAGADVREFGQPPREPHLPDVVLALEGAAKPWVAALHGTVLGGGLEIALGCAHRIAAPGTKLGFPEVNLGLIPGAGGTVRAPRLIDPAAALGLCAGGRPVDATEAAALGLVDAVAEGDLDAAATAMAERAADAPRPVPLAARAPLPASDDWPDRVARAVAEAGPVHAPRAAAEAVDRAVRLGADDALAAERAAFVRLRDDPQSAALRHVFLAERAASKLPELKGVDPRPVDRVGVVGGGTMGAGIASACLLRGLHVTLLERDDAAAEAGRGRIEGILADSHRRGLVDAARHAALRDALAVATDPAALAPADLVIEAVFEDMEVKAGVLSSVEAVVRDDAILASNTSYLDLDALAARARVPERVIGLHFFSPAHVMKLLEVVIPDGCAPDVVATGFALAKRLGKIAVPAGVCDGFVGNRIMAAYRRAAEFMVADGAAPAQVDAAMRGHGWRMGLFEVQDLAGLDIAWAMRKRRAATRDPGERYFDGPDRLCEMGRLGRKAGAGWYDYAEGRAVESETVARVLDAARADAGLTPRRFTDAEIVDGLLAAMRAEAEAVLAEGIARSADDIDVVMINGYGFPRWRGGPMFSGRAG